MQVTSVSFRVAAETEITAALGLPGQRGAGSHWRSLVIVDRARHDGARLQDF